MINIPSDIDTREDLIELEASKELMSDLGMDSDTIEYSYFDLGYLARHRKYTFPFDSLNKLPYDPSKVTFMPSDYENDAFEDDVDLDDVTFEYEESDDESDNTDNSLN
jgi:hypothetical protein